MAKSSTKKSSAPAETEEQQKKREYETLLSTASYDADQEILALCKEVRDTFERIKEKFLEECSTNPTYGIDWKAGEVVAYQELVRLADEVEFKRHASGEQSLFDNTVFVFGHITEELVRRTHANKSNNPFRNAVEDAKGEAHKLFYDRLKTILMQVGMKEEATEKLKEMTHELNGVITVVPEKQPAENKTEVKSEGAKPEDKPKSDEKKS